MHPDVYVQFATIIGVATAFGILLHLLKQPLVAAYLLAGVLLSFFQLVYIPVHSPLAFLPTIGVAFLLFLIGIELDITELRGMGKAIALACCVQTAVMTAVVAVIATILHYAAVPAVLTGMALSFSSTIVVIKLLLDKHETTSLHGRIALGILMLQDIIAIFVMMFLSFSQETQGSISFMPIADALIKGLFLFILVIVAERLIITRLFRLVATNQELLFLTAISWCFLFIVLAIQLGYSLEIGAFLAGLSLASSPYRFQIAGRLKPLRDFFVAIFFVTLGQGILFTDIVHHLGLIFLFIGLVLVVKPMLFMGILSFLKFRKFTLFQSSIAMSQVSEFSILIFYAANQAGLIDRTLLSIIAITTIISIFVSAIVINQSNRLYQVFRRSLSVFERSNASQKATEGKKLTDHIILIGAHYAGEPVITYLKEKAGEQLLVVDYNPKVIDILANQAIPLLFGDISDPDIIDQLSLGEARLIISTIRNKKDTAILLDNIRQQHSKAVIIMAAESDEEAALLYAHGAHEVIVPSHLEGLHVVNLIAHHWHHLDQIKERTSMHGFYRQQGRGGNNVSV